MFMSLPLTLSVKGAFCGAWSRPLARWVSAMGADGGESVLVLGG
jgi:hypothetical protein